MALGGRGFKCVNNNQMGDSDDVRGCIGEEARLGQNVWGGWLRTGPGLRWLPSRKSYTTTNQEQEATAKGGMKGMHDEQEVRGKHNTIVSGGVRVEWR